MSRFARHLRKTALALALGLAATSACAQTQVVTDPGAYLHMGAELTELKNQLTQLQRLWDTGQQQLQQLQSMITGLSNLNPQLGDANLQKVTDSQRNNLIQTNCKSDHGFVGNLIDALSSSKSSIDVQQQNICAQIVSLQLDKYNVTVDMLENVQKQQKGFFDEINNILGQVKSVADTGRLNTQAQSYSNALTTDMANWRAQMDAKDTMIRTLQAQQGMLGRAALNGSGSAASNVISTGVLLGVLQGLKK